MKPQEVRHTEEMLKKLNIDAEVIEHSKVDGTRSNIIADYLNVPLNCIIKCLILKSKDNRYAEAIILGSQKLDIKKITLLSGLKKLSLASPDNIKELTGYDIGGIPPIALINKFPIYIDEKVFEKKYIIGSAGSPYYGLKFAPIILKKFDIIIANISI